MIRISQIKLGVSLAVALAVGGCQDREEVTEPQARPSHEITTSSAGPGPFAYVANFESAACR